MSSYDINYYINLLASLTFDHLQNLLSMFGRNKRGSRHTLLDRAIHLLIIRPAGLNWELFLTKIKEFHESVQNQRNLSNIKLNMDTMLNQPQNMPLGMQTQVPRKTPQYFQQNAEYKPRVGLSQVIPQTQRDMLSQVSRAPLRQQPIQVSPNPVYGSNSSNTGNSFINSSIPRPQSQRNIQFQKLPFFEVVAVVIKPTILSRSQSANSSEMKNALFNLVMDPAHVNFISENRDVSNGKTDYIYQAQIRICSMKDRFSDITDFMPLGIHIEIGNKTCSLPPFPCTKPEDVRRIARPINCTEQLLLNPNVIQKISIHWCPDEETYVFAMFIVKQLTSENLLIKLKEKPARSVDETKNDIIKMMINVDPDLATMSYRVSSMCPLGQAKMNLPAKSVKCDHLQCFDAETFILMNERKPTWTCPTCKKPCLYDDIRIETYFLEIVTSPNLPDCSGEIELLNDGTWRVFSENNELKNLESSAEKKPIDFVNLDDSDDDSPI